MTPNVVGPAIGLEQYQRALEASERRSRLLIEKNADGVVVVRRDGVICYANPAAAALLRRCARQLVGEMFGIPVVPGETTELDIPHANKGSRVAEMRVAEIEWEGEPAFLASLRDITERRHAAESLRFLDEASTLLAGSLDTHRTLQTAARLAVMHLADWCFIDLLEDDQQVHRVVTAHADPGREELAARLRGRYPLEIEAGIGLPKVFRTGRPKVRLDITGEFLHTLGPGPEQQRVLECLGCKAVMIAPLTARNRTLGAIGFVASAASRRYDAASLTLAEDLARRVALAIDNARLYDESREMVRRRDEFLAMLSHELRNPLAAILQASQLLAHQAGPAPAFQQTRDIVERQGRHMTRLLDDLLDISRVTHGKIELRKETVDLSAVLVDAIQAIQPALDAQDHSLVVTLPGESLWVEADPTRLSQVVSNLLNNAAKYTNRRGRLEVSLQQEGPQAVLRVRDDGVGIPPEMLSSIFELFTQVESSLERSEGGLGIGLTLVRRLVELHGGSVGAHSDGVGKGSEFVVRLPLVAGDGERTPSRHNGVASPSTSAGPRRVLLVEDNADSRTMLRDLLEIWGHEVREAQDGLAGLEEITGWGPDVALIDIGLPTMNGYELAKAARLREVGRRPFLVALTGYGRPEDRKRALDAGFDDHLVKPVDLAALEKLLVSR